MHEHSIRMGEGGRLVIPATLRKQMGVEPGDALVVRLEDGELRLFQQTVALKRLRSAVKQHGLKNFSVDDFLASRRDDSGE